MDKKESYSHVVEKDQEQLGDEDDLVVVGISESLLSHQKDVLIKQEQNESTSSSESPLIKQEPEEANSSNVQVTQEPMPSSSSGFNCLLNFPNVVESRSYLNKVKSELMSKGEEMDEQIQYKELRIRTLKRNLHVSKGLEVEVDKDMKQLEVKKRRLQSEIQEDEEHFEREQSELIAIKAKRDIVRDDEQKIDVRVKAAKEAEFKAKVALLCPGKTRDDLEEMLRCAVCLNVPAKGSDAMVCQKCDNFICVKCLKSLKKQTCPFCRMRWRKQKPKTSRWVKALIDAYHI